MVWRGRSRLYYLGIVDGPPRVLHPAAVDKSARPREGPVPLVEEKKKGPASHVLGSPDFCLLAVTLACRIPHGKYRNKSLGNGRPPHRGTHCTRQPVKLQLGPVFPIQAIFT